MVRTRISRHAKINRDLLAKAIDIFGKTLTHRVYSRTIDTFGQLSAISETDTTFKGDLQFGVDLDQRLIEQGYVEVGEAVLYLHPTALSTLPSEQDAIVDDDGAVWEIVEQIENAQLGGDSTHLTYRCRRRINSSD